MVIDFKVDGMELICGDPDMTISSGSKNFLKAQFEFDGNWEELSNKEGIFILSKDSRDGLAVSVPFASDINEEGACVVPYQAINMPGTLHVGVKATNGSVVARTTYATINVMPGVDDGYTDGFDGDQDLDLDEGKLDYLIDRIDAIVERTDNIVTYEEDEEEEEY